MISIISSIFLSLPFSDIFRTVFRLLSPSSEPPSFRPMMTVHCYSYIVTLTRCYCVQPPKPCVVSSYAVLPYGMPLPDTRIAPPPSTANCTASNRHTLSSLLSQFDSQINPHTHCMPIRPIIDRPHRGSSCPSSAPVVCMACMCKQASGARGAAAASCPQSLPIA